MRVMYFYPESARRQSVSPARFIGGPATGGGDWNQNRLNFYFGG
jgi:hypothetical protein